MNKHLNTTHNDVAPILSGDRSVALNRLIKLTQNLSNLADREAQALAQNDMLGFAILQDEKTLITEQYVSACEEFRSNINLYRGVDKSLLDRLDRLQKDLGEKTKANNDTVSNIYDRAQNRTQSSLLAAQEIGQNKHVQFEQREPEVGQRIKKQAKGA